MRAKFILGLLLTFVCIGFVSCEKEDVNSEPMLIVKFKFDENQIRLNNLGQPSVVSAGNAAQSPVFNTISSHYVELASDANTALGHGTILYRGPETVLGGSNAVDFSQAKIVAEDEIYLKIPLRQIVKGSYEWVRVSLTYQNYDIVIRQDETDYTGTLASFVGFNTYIGTHSIGNSTFPIDGNRLQGYWALNVQGMPFSGQAPAGATTVPNPIASSSPIPAGSCVVTGKFANNLVITGNETQDVEMTLSLSINNSFEWHEVNVDGKYEPSAGENVVDMGLRGLIPSF